MLVRDPLSGKTSGNVSIDECLTLMTENQIRHLPAIEHGSVVGAWSSQARID